MSGSLPKRIWRLLRGGCGTKAAAARLGDSPPIEPAPAPASHPLERLGLLDCFGMSDKGRVRECNEDQFLIADLSRPATMCPVLSSLGEAWDGDEIIRANLLLVADGVGGHAGGQRASRLAVEEVAEFLHCNLERLTHHAECGRDEVLEDLKSALIWARQCLQQEADALPQYAKMGTTLTLAYLRWPTVFLAHVGDSRAYLYRAPDLIQLTNDQTFAQMLVDAGVITTECAQSHPWRNVLGSLLCYDLRRLVPCVYQQELSPGDQLLLCTDGLTKTVPAGAIAEILESTVAADDACRELIEAANRAGGPDNTTVVLARFGYREAGSNPRLELPVHIPIA